MQPEGGGKASTGKVESEGGSCEPAPGRRHTLPWVLLTLQGAPGHKVAAWQGLAGGEGVSTVTHRQKRGSPCQPLSSAPSPGMSNHETLQQIAKGYRLPRPAACPAEVYVLMLACWKGSPEERPAFTVLQEKLGTIHRCLHATLT